LPRYTNGPIDVALSYHRIKGKDSSSDAVDISNWAVGGTYDFNVVKLAAFYDQNKWKDVLGLGVDDLKLKSWLLGVTVPFGKHAILGSYTQQSKASSLVEGKSRQWALGYTYSLSKRTNVYAVAADITNKNDRKGNYPAAIPGVGGNFLGAQSTDASNNGQGYQNGLQFGLKHTF
jgi:predicted porin